MHLPRVGHYVIAGAQIQGEPGRRFEVVLNIKPMTARNQPHQARRKSVAQYLVGYAHEEACECVAAGRSGRGAGAQIEESEKAATIGQITRATHLGLIIEAELEHVAALGPRDFFASTPGCGGEAEGSQEAST